MTSIQTDELKAKYISSKIHHSAVFFFSSSPNATSNRDLHHNLVTCIFLAYLKKDNEEDGGERRFVWHITGLFSKGKINKWRSAQVDSLEN